MTVQRFQILSVGEHTWKAVIAVPESEVSNLLDDVNRVFIMKNLKYDSETCEAIVTLEPGNGMMAIPDDSSLSK